MKIFNDNISFQKIKNSYNKQYNLCEKLGKYYINDGKKLLDIKCGKWECKVCRTNLKNKLYENILRNIYCFDLQKHFIITFGGKKYRNKYSIEESYKMMSKAWDNFKKVIEYHYGNISYIKLPRAQKSGYCHYHILTNKYLDWKFLNKKRKKYGLGFVSIQKNKDVAEYLNKDFFNETEWMIPKGIRHYTSSQDIKFLKYKKDESNKYFTNKMKLEQIIDLLKKEKGIIIDLDSYYIQKILNIITDKKGYRIDYYNLNHNYEQCRNVLTEELREKNIKIDDIVANDINY